MLIPRAIFHVAKFAAKAQTRYALNGVHVSRSAEGIAKVQATDGRRLIMVSWDEDDREQYPDIGVDLTHTAGFDAIIPLPAWEKAAKAIPKKTSRPILENAFLCETVADSNKVTLGATDLEVTEKFEVLAIEGKFPDCEAVWPDISKKRTVPDTGYIEFGINPDYMTDMLKVFKLMLPGDDSMVILHVPVPNSHGDVGIGAIVMRRKFDGMDIRAMLMPVELTSDA